MGSNLHRTQRDYAEWNTSILKDYKVHGSMVPLITSSRWQNYGDGEQIIACQILDMWKGMTIKRLLEGACLWW